MFRCLDDAFYLLIYHITPDHTMWYFVCIIPRCETSTVPCLQTKGEYLHPNDREDGEVLGVDVSIMMPLKLTRIVIAWQKEAVLSA